MTFPKEFKDAISNLSSAEKDKLIFRLLKKDVALANRLHFELLSEETVDEKRDKLQKILDFRIERATDLFYSPGYLSMDVRDMSGLINEHVSITKDKYGEAWLNLYLLNNILKKNTKNLQKFRGRKVEKFYIPVIARIFKILLILNKLHEDYFTEFREPLSELGNQITVNPDLLKISSTHGLDISWLDSGNIPDDIILIHKQLREQGFLK